VQLADVKGMGVKRAKQKGTHVIVPNYYPRPPGRGPLTLAKLVWDGYCLGFYCGCTFRFTFYGLGYFACVQNWSELDSHAIEFSMCSLEFNVVGVPSRVIMCLSAQLHGPAEGSARPGWSSKTSPLS